MSDRLLFTHFGQRGRDAVLLCHLHGYTITGRMAAVHHAKRHQEKGEAEVIPGEAIAPVEHRYRIVIAAAHHGGQPQ